jgi:hypothetical protein
MAAVLAAVTAERHRSSTASVSGLRQRCAVAAGNQSPPPDGAHYCFAADPIFVL